MASLKLFAALREAAGRDSDEFEAQSVRELVEEAKRRYGPEFSLQLEFATVAVNGVLIDHLDGEDTRLGSSDEVALMPPVSGGSAPRIARIAT